MGIKTNTLNKLRPDLLNFWDYTNNEVNPCEVTTGSAKKVYWLCSKCCAPYKKSIRQRVNAEVSYCYRCLSFGSNYPELLNEWDYIKNTEDPYSVRGGLYWWVCSKCSFSWRASIQNRTHINNPTNCPACAGQKVSPSNSFLTHYPEIAKEWHQSKNKKKPSDYTHHSSKVVWWRCIKCGWEWKSTVYNRADGKGCPVCAGVQITPDNNLVVLRPDLMSTWNYKRNKKIDPTTISPNSSKRVWWVCEKDECGHEWRSTVDNRARGRQCPSCSNRVATENNNLLNTRPDLIKDWDYTLNKVDPSEIVPGHNGKVWWSCHKCGHVWDAVVNSRAGGKGCPKCNKGRVSNISQEWLNQLKIPLEFREYNINTKKGVFKVDGFDPKTNTIYEFLGDYWHGNPEKFNLNDINEVNKKSFGTLYEEWLERKDTLSNAGYKVVYIWEKTFRERNKQ